MKIYSLAIMDRCFGSSKVTWLCAKILLSFTFFILFVDFTCFQSLRPLLESKLTLNALLSHTFTHICGRFPCCSITKKCRNFCSFYSKFKEHDFHEDQQMINFSKMFDSFFQLAFSLYIWWICIFSCHISSPFSLDQASIWPVLL